MAGAPDSRASAIGKRVEQAIGRSGKDVLRLLGELSGLRDDLAAFAGGMSEAVRDALARPINDFAKADPGFLDALSTTITEMLREAPEESDEDEDDTDEDEAAPLTAAGRRQILDVFRRAMRAEGRWYPEMAGLPSNAHPAEIDLIMLAMVRAATAFEQDRLLSARLADRRPPILDNIANLRRNQVLVDEMSDFTPAQLACMSALSNARTRSLFLSGDFNQRLTQWDAAVMRKLIVIANTLLKADRLWVKSRA